MNIENAARKFASKIVSQLNKMDSDSTDNIIDASVWKQYAVSKWGIKDSGQNISIFKAEDSIVKYLKNNSKTTGKSISELGEKWYKDLTEIKTEKPKTADSKPLINLTPKSFEEKSFSTSVSNINIREEKIIQRSKLNFELCLPYKYKYEECKRSVTKLIKKELERKNIKVSLIDINYWSSKIGYMKYKYNIPEEILISIISRECTFRKQISSRNGNGVMALTTVAIKDMFRKEHWADTYAMLDNDLYNDIFYENGNEDGKFVLKYKDEKDVRRDCGKDDSLSMKVGTLYFEMTYAKVLTMKLLKKKDISDVTEKDVRDTITKLKSGKIDFSKIDNESVVAIALQNYNGNPAYMISYKNDTMRSLRVQSYNFEEQNIIRRY